MENAAKLHESTGQIANPVEGESTDGKLEAPFAEGHKVRIGGDPHSLAPRQKRRRRVGGNDPFHAGSKPERAGECAVVGANIECRAELLSDVVEALDEPVGDLGMQEVDAAIPCRPVAVHSQSAAIEECDWISRRHR